MEIESPFSIRTINIKLVPTVEQAELLDRGIETFSKLHDLAVNRYVKLSDPEMVGEEAKKLRRELKSPDCNGTFVDLAIGAKSADRYFRTLRKMAKKDIIARNKIVKKLEEEKVNLTKPKSVWFNPVKNVEGTCAMCGRVGNMPYRANEVEYKEECLCEVCAVDFFKYRSELYSLKRHIKKNYFLCKELAPEMELSKGFENILDKFDRPVGDFKGTVSNKMKIKGGQLKMDFETRLATMTLPTSEKLSVGFVGEHYYTKFPTYGTDSGTNKYITLITKFLTEGGYPSLVRKSKGRNRDLGEDSGYSGNWEYYLSIPVHYPMMEKAMEVEGCILVSQRKVMLYINGKIKFVELFNPYFRKRCFDRRHKTVQKQNAELRVCHWGLIPKKNRIFLLNLKNKLGYDWLNERDVYVTKSEDDNTVVITENNNGHRTIEISLDRKTGTASLVSSDGSSHTLYIVENKKEGGNGYSVTDLYVDEPVILPNKYSDGNLSNYINHQNKEVSRRIVEEAKRMLSDKGSVVLLDMTYMHPEGEGVVPMIALNGQIMNMLKYDSIYKGSIYWGHLKELTCPNCHTVQQEKSENRLVIRDILLSNITSWICEEDNCDNKINNPLIAVARHVMSSDMEDLLKKPTKKETKEDKKEEDSI